jgi:hypothetical protein
MRSPCKFLNQNVFGPLIARNRHLRGAMLGHFKLQCRNLESFNG